MRIKSLLVGLLIFAVGLIMVIIPRTVFNIVVIITGAATIADGIYSLIKAHKDNVQELKKPVLIRSIVCIVVGIAAVAFPTIFHDSINIVCTIIGFVLAVLLVAYAAFSFYASAKLIDNPEKKKALTTEGLICLLVAIILFIILPASLSFNAEGTTERGILEVITTIAGIIGMVIGVIIMAYEITIFVLHKKDKQTAVEVVEIADADAGTETTDKQDE